jgi:hypothetical protein
MQFVYFADASHFIFSDSQVTKTTPANDCGALGTPPWRLNTINTKKRLSLKLLELEFRRKSDGCRNLRCKVNRFVNVVDFNSPVIRQRSHWGYLRVDLVKVKKALSFHSPRGIVSSAP